MTWGSLTWSLPLLFHLFEVLFAVLVELFESQGLTGRERFLGGIRADWRLPRRRPGRPYRNRCSLQLVKFDKSELKLNLFCLLILFMNTTINLFMIHNFHEILITELFCTSIHLFSKTHFVYLQFLKISKIKFLPIKSGLH